LADGDTYAVVRGSFDWKRLAAYAVNQGGSCEGPVCRMPASEAGRFISFYPLRSNVLALAVSRDTRAVKKIGLPDKIMAVAVTAPVAIFAPGFAFERISGFPPGAQAFLSPLARAKRVSFFIHGGDRTADLMGLELDAETGSNDIAQEIAKQLQSTTELLKNMLAREKMTPRPDDLSGVLVGGTFETKGDRVSGSWPLDRQFLESLFTAAPAPAK
jgi:hypothetical protein